MPANTVIITKQAEAMRPHVGEEAKVAKVIAIMETERFTPERGKAIGPSPMGEIRRFRAGKVRIMAACSEGMVTIVGFGVRA